MVDIGYMRSNYDSFVYFKMLGDGSFVILMLYVDDMLIAPNNMHELKSLKSILWKKFDMKNLGTAKKIIGMEI